MYRIKLLTLKPPKIPIEIDNLIPYNNTVSVYEIYKY
jgi:hypothetical protein